MIEAIPFSLFLSSLIPFYCTVLKNSNVPKA